MLRKTKIRVAQSYTVACIVKCDGLATSNVYNELISLYNELLSLKIRGKNTEYSGTLTPVCFVVLVLHGSDVNGGALDRGPNCEIWSPKYSLALIFEPCLCAGPHTGSLSSLSARGPGAWWT